MPAPDLKRRVEENLGLVRAQAAALIKGLPAIIEFDDLVSYGTEGLCEAAARFEDGRGVAFATFAYYRIRGAMYDGLRRFGWLNRREWARVRERERIDAYLQSHADREGARPQAGLEDDLAALAETLAGVTTVCITSMDLPGLEVADAGSEPADEALGLGELGALMRAAIPDLPPQERHILEAFYFRGKNLLEAGQELGLSKSWACRLHASGVDRLRQRLLPQVSGEPRPPVPRAPGGGPAALRATPRPPPATPRPPPAAPRPSPATPRPPRR